MSNMQVWTDVYVIEKVCTSVYVYMYAQNAHIYKYICRLTILWKKKTPGKVYQDVFTFHILLKNIANRILRHKVIIIYMYNSK